jgi:hypothetical protein
MPTASPSPVDQAFNRCLLLSRLLDLARQRAISDPTHQRNVAIGLAGRGQKRPDAIRSIEDAFEDLGGLVNHLALIDMAGAFERHFRLRLDTAIGEARKVIRERYRSSIPLHAHRESLVRQAHDFQGLADIERLIGGRVSAEIRDEWEMIRKNRNNFAHGTDIRAPPTITNEQARQTLNEIIEIL